MSSELKQAIEEYYALRSEGSYVTEAVSGNHAMATFAESIGHDTYRYSNRLFSMNEDGLITSREVKDPGRQVSMGCHAHHPYYAFVWQNTEESGCMVLYEAVDGKDGTVELMPIIKEDILLFIEGKNEYILLYEHAVDEKDEDSPVETILEVRDMEMNLVLTIAPKDKMRVEMGDEHAYVNVGKYHALYLYAYVDRFGCVLVVRFDLNTGKIRYMDYLPRQVQFAGKYWVITRIGKRSCMLTDNGVVFNRIFNGDMSIVDDKISFTVKNKKTGVETVVEWAPPAVE